MSLENIGIVGSLIVGFGGLIVSIFNSIKQKKNDEKMLLVQKKIHQDDKIFDDKYDTIKRITLEIRQFISIANNLLNAISLITKGVRNYRKEELIKEAHKLSEYIKEYEITIPAARIFLGNDIYKKAMDVLMLLTNIESSVSEIIEDDFNLTETVIDDDNKTLGEYDRLINLTKLRKFAQIHLDKLEELFLNELETK